MARIGSTLLVHALLGATAAAFAVAERLKLQTAPVAAVRIDKLFSPVCACATNVANVGFRLRKRDAVTLAIVDGEGSVVRRLARAKPLRPGVHSFVWDGRDHVGRVVPEGTYRPRVALQKTGRTIVFPNPIEVDTTPPTARVLGLSRSTISPDGDGRAEQLTVYYRVEGVARAALLIDGERGALSRFRKPRRTLHWRGRIRGRPLAPGTYALSLVAEDRAGNRSRPVPVGRVRILTSGTGSE